jgi:hypothetical protein
LLSILKNDIENIEDIEYRMQHWTRVLTYVGLPSNLDSLHTCSYGDAQRTFLIQKEGRPCEIDSANTYSMGYLLTC